MGERVRVAAFGVCVDDGHVLLSRFADGRWTLPGGGVDFGEDPYDGVIREVAEETGYAVAVDEVLGILTWVWDDTSTHQVSIVYEVSVVDGELTHEVDGTTEEAAWMPVDSVGSLPRIELVDTGLELLRHRPAGGRIG
jgi:8-oxo-dGTP diphosphatase